MHNTYFSSTLVSLGGRGSLSFSSIDCPQRNPFLGSSTSSSSDCCCCCCSCCACSSHRVPTNPSYLIGGRQSNLIQWSCSRRLVLGGGRRYINGLDLGLDPSVYDVSCTVKKRSGYGGVRRTSVRRRCMDLEDESERYGFGGLGDVEAMINLLSEEIDECFGRKERGHKGVEAGSGSGRKKKNVGLSSSRCKTELVDAALREENCRRSSEKKGLSISESTRTKKKNVGLSSSEIDSKDRFESVDIASREEDCRRGRERKGLSIGESNTGRKKNMRLTAIESDLKGKAESVDTALREEDRRQSKEREEFLFSKDENRRMRKEGSTSSYYSFSSSGEFGSDGEAQVKHGGIVEESSNEFRKDSRTEEGKFSEVEVAEERHDEASRWKNTAVTNGVEWDWRKNSEKKLAQVSIEDDQSRKEASQMDYQMTMIKESGYGKASSSRKQVNDEEENLISVGISKKETYKQYGQSESRIKHQELIDQQESIVDKKSRTQNQFSGREEKRNDIITAGEHHKIVGSISRKYDSRTNSEQLTRVSEQRKSETRMKNWEESSTSVLSLDEEQHHLKDERATGQVGLKKQSHQGFTETSEARGSNTELTSILQSGSKMKTRSQSFGVASSLGPDAVRQQSRTDQGVVRRIQSQKGSQDATTSLARAGDSVTVISSRRSSEKRVTDQEMNLARERRSEIDDRVTQLETRAEVGKPKVSSSGASLTLVSPGRPQKIVAGEGSQRSSPARMMPPPAQLVSRASFHIEQASGVTSSGHGAPDLDVEAHGNPSNFVTDEDALGSAYRSEKFSAQYVGEFIEQARHDISTSEIQNKVSETILAHEHENRKRKALGEYEPGDSQLKEHDSKRTSGGSGTKGPSDEMWDVTDPSFREPSNTKDPEVSIPTENTSENAIVRRSSRSLWNVIGDIARLRWGSRAESPGSAVRSGTKGSPDESVGTEVWFSGHEPESHDENEKKKTVVPQETATSYEQQLGKSSSSEGEVSDAMKSKDKKRVTEADMSYPSSMVGTGSATISLTSGEENLGSNEERKSFPGNTSGGRIAESSLPLSAGGSRRSSSTGEISETGKVEHNTRLTEELGTEGKDGELKQRRLKRDKQILRESFDDWEEAYNRESEQRKIDEMFMREALLESRKAADAWEVPVGAVLVKNGTIVARGYNLVEELRDSTAHAEMICIREASNQLKTWRLADTTLYVTLEPCPMCAGAILQARIDTLVWGAPNKLLGADGSWVRLFPNGGSQSSSELGDEPSLAPAAPIHPFHPNMKIRRGVLAGECAEAMQQFFKLRRKSKARKPDLPSPSSTLAVRRHPSKFISKMQQMFHIMFCL